MNVISPFERQLRDELHDALDGLPVEDRSWPAAHTDIRRRARARRQRVRGAVAVVAAAATVAAIIISVQPSAQRRHVPAPAVSSPLRTVATAAVKGSDPARIVAGAGALFAALWDTGSVVRFDPDTLRQTGSLDVGSRQNGPLSIAYGADSLWVLNFADGRLWRIDPATMLPTAKIKLSAEPSQVAFGDGAVWVTVCCGTTHTATRQKLLRIDPGTGQIAGSVVVPGDGETVNVAVGPQVLVSSQDAPISVIDPQTMTIERQLHTGCDRCEAPGLAVGEGSFYVTGSTSIERFSADTGKLLAESTPLGVHSTATPMALAPDGLWLSTEDELLRLSVTDLRVTEHVALPSTAQVVVAEPSLFVSLPGRVVRLSRDQRQESPRTILTGEVAYKCGDSICLMRPDGSQRRTLDATFPEWDPAWSPDGQHLAFRGYRTVQDGSYAIYVVGANGCQPVRLPGTAGGTNPTWSPNGQQIAYDGGGINVVDADGANAHALTRDRGGQIDISPAWSRSGRIAFVRSTPGSTVGEIFAINPDGSGTSALTHGGRGFQQPAWSEDGTGIAFVEGPSSATAQKPLVIDVANGDGTNRHPVSPAAWISYDPTWTPGGQVVFLAQRGSDVNAYVVNSDGSDLHRLYAGLGALPAAVQITWGDGDLPPSRC